MKEIVLREFKLQCREQILSDGMHFELSPMYHNIILEDMFRVAMALRKAGSPDQEVEKYLSPMINVAFSLGEGLDRVPLFNDGGNNVSKSLDSLLDTARNCFEIIPAYCASFPESGYYIFKQGPWKLIVDAGMPGPRCNPGHAHCDAMSYELFRDGKPILVNCGTYAYQCKERNFFRSTAAHNTAMVEGGEQSDMWGTFRMAKGSIIQQVKLQKQGIEMEMTDQRGHVIRRIIQFHPDKLVIEDVAKESVWLRGFVHYYKKIRICTQCQTALKQYEYAQEYGEKEYITGVEFKGNSMLKYAVILND